MIDFKICLADILIHYSVKYLGTKKYLHRFEGTPKYELQERIIVCNEDYKRYGLDSNTAMDEVQILAYLTSKALLSYNTFLFHGAAFEWNEKVWIFSAPSGTGKTTQCQNWIKAFPNEITMINGDKPILKWNDRFFTVYPSPWMGKERYGSNKVGNLAGIIILEQDKTNSFCRLKQTQAVIPILKQFITFMESEKEIDKVIDLEEKLLQTIPIFLFRNTGNIDSTALLRQYLGEYMMKKENGETSDI